MCSIYHGPEVYITHIERWIMVYMIYLRQNWPWFYNSSIFVTPPISCACVLVTFLYVLSGLSHCCCASISFNSLLYLKILSNWWMIKKIATKILLRRRALPYIWVSENDFTKYQKSHVRRSRPKAPTARDLTIGLSEFMSYGFQQLKMSE